MACLISSEEEGIAARCRDPPMLLSSTHTGSVDDLELGEFGKAFFGEFRA
jgi:hypothetical protein